jgi:hypothetical protein
MIFFKLTKFAQIFGPYITEPYLNYLTPKKYFYIFKFYKWPISELT